MSITGIHFRAFTAFEDFRIEPSPGINVLIGPNSTGKTHLMKATYAACAVSKTGDDYLDKLVRVLLPSGKKLRRLAKNNTERHATEMAFERGTLRADATIHLESSGPYVVSTFSNTWKYWLNRQLESVYIPAKEILSNGPGFLSLYNEREIHFDETFSDLLLRAYLPPLKKPPEPAIAGVLSKLEEKLGGTVITIGQEFFLENDGTALEFTLLAEGLRKVGLLWLLIRNGSISPGSVLFWDEPESNLNPGLFRTVVAALLELQRNGVQIFLATHDYVVLREFDLQKEAEDRVLFHVLHRDPASGEIECRTTDRFSDIHPNAILEAFDSIYDREIERSVGGATP